MTTQEEREFTESLRGMFERSDRAAADSMTYYSLLRKSHRLTGTLIFEGRCASARCLLVHVFQTPAGPAFYLPGYKLSEASNERESSESGRRENTTDGLRHWRADASLLRYAANLPLNCDHYRGTLELDAISGAPGKPTRQTFPPLHTPDDVLASS